MLTASLHYYGLARVYESYTCTVKEKKLGYIDNRTEQRVLMQNYSEKT